MLQIIKANFGNNLVSLIIQTLLFGCNNPPRFCSISLDNPTFRVLIKSQENSNKTLIIISSRIKESVTNQDLRNC